MADANPVYHIAKGFTLKVNNVSVGSVSSIGGIEISVDTEEIACVTDTDAYKKFMPTFRDAGEVPIEGFVDTDDAGQTELQSIKDSDAPVPCEIVFPPDMGLKWTFNAVMTKYKIGEAKAGELLKYSTTLKVSGKPSLVQATEAAG